MQVLNTNTVEIRQKEENGMEEKKRVEGRILLIAAANLSNPEYVWNFHCSFPIFKGIAVQVFGWALGLGFFWLKEIQFICLL